MDLSQHIIEQKTFTLDSGAKITLIRESSSYELAKAIQKAKEKHEKAIKKADSDKAKAKLEEKYEDELCGLYANHLITDFEGFLFKGKEVPYSQKNARAMMKNRDFKSYVLTTVRLGDFSDEVELDIDFGEVQKN